LNDIRPILERVNPTDKPVSADLLPLLYDELRNLASGYMSREAPGQTLQPTALVHEAWIKLTKDDARLWSDRAHFFRAAAQAMRCILVDRARSKASLKHGARAQLLDIQQLDLAETTMDERLLLVDEMLGSLETEHPICARIVSLKFFGGLTNKEIAQTEGMVERTVERHWAYAKVRLIQMIREENSGKATA
jgi:RNA polymerase sigma factor (TIGR02999 family)